MSYIKEDKKELLLKNNWILQKDICHVNIYPTDDNFKDICETVGADINSDRISLLIVAHGEHKS